MPTNFLQPTRIFDPTVPELMDQPQPVSDQLERDLTSLQRLNRWFGSYRLIQHFLDRWIPPETSVSLLDLCTASADIPRRIVEWARLKQVQIVIDAVEQQAATLQIARERCAGYPEINLIAGDVLQIEPSESYDLVFCSLALHHFQNAEAIALLRRILAFGRVGVVVADLERTDFGRLGFHALSATMFREKMTRHDGRLSFQRAFSYPELNELARQAGWNDFGHRRFLFCRQAIWLDLARGNPKQAFRKAR